MSEQKLDIKDIKEAVSDLIGKSESKWQEELKNREKETQDSLSKALDKLQAEQAQKAAEIAKAQTEEAKKAMQDQFDELATKIAEKKGQNRNVTFKSAIAEGLKAKHDELVKSAQTDKKSIILDLKDFNLTDFTGNEDFRTDFSGSPILNPYESFHYRNIIPRGSTGGAYLSYPKETATAGGADTWAHTGDATVAKPEILPSMEPYTVKVEWIAGLIKGIPVEMVEDLAWMTSYLQNKAMNELMKAEDMQVQDGDGATPNLDGFFNGTNATAYDGSKTIFIEKIIDAAYRQIADAHYQANKAVISNSDKVDVLLMEKSTGAGYGTPGGTVAIVNGRINMAGLEIYSNSYLAPGQALVGDFNESQFVVRSAPRLRFFDQNADDAEKNQLLVRIEERVALAIFSNLAFVKMAAGT